jgi:V/A-type H+-transporting ATPase subunit C
VAYGRHVREAVRYGFSVGRVRVLEGRLLDTATLERLIDAEDFLAQKRVLADTEYGAAISGCDSGTDVERALESYLTDLFAFLETSGLPDAVIKFFRVAYDYRNLKGRLKAEALDVPIEGMLEPHGTLPMELFSGPTELLPDRFRALEASVRDTDGSVDRLRIDPLVDRAMYEEVLAVAEDSGSEMLVRIARLDIDLANARTVLRARRLGWAAEDAAMALVAGGTVKPDALMRGFGQSLAEVAERLASMLHLPGAGAEDLQNVERLDVTADNLLMRLAKRGRMAATGVDPVAGYVMTRRSEVVTLRTLLLGKIAGLGADALRGRVRELYV